MHLLLKGGKGIERETEGRVDGDERNTERERETDPIKSASTAPKLCVLCVRLCVCYTQREESAAAAGEAEDEEAEEEGRGTYTPDGC